MFHRPRTRTVLSSMLALSVLALTACGGSGSTRSTDPPGEDREGAALLQSNVARAPSDTVDITDTTEGLRELGHDLSTHLPAGSGNGGNQVFSPVSLAIAFAMLREGAGQASGHEIDDVIGLPSNRQAAYSALLHRLGDVGDGDVLEINDALFLDPKLQVEESYLDAIQKWYGAGLHQTAFPAPALDDINGWVDQHTHGRIPRLLDDLDPAAVFALVNTIYLKAKWQIPFDASDTREDAFTTASGGRETVQTMHNGAEYDFANGAGWQAVRLPYAGGKLSMWVLVPAGSGDPKELLRGDVLGQAVDDAAPARVDLSLPRWDTETQADLTDVLGRLGLSKTLQPAQFPGVTDDPRFKVSQVVQQANITVGEKGTEAAAASAIVGELSTVAPTGVTVSADHPFAYAIVQDDTEVPLFEGVVGDPSQK